MSSDRLSSAGPPPRAEYSHAGAARPDSARPDSARPDSVQTSVTRPDQVQAGPARTGHRRRGAGHYRAAAVPFAGLEAGCGHPKQLLEPLRRAGSALPFPRAVLDCLALLFDFSNPRDWTAPETEEAAAPGAPAAPLVFPSNAELAGCLGIHERTVRVHLRHLADAGAIVIRHGPGNRRTPVRDHAGRITEAYGIDLGPMVAFAAEMEAAADAAALRRRRLKAARRQLMVALQEVRMAADALTIVAGEQPGNRPLAAAAAELTERQAAAEAAAATAQAALARDPGLAGPAQAANETLILQVAASLAAVAAEANRLAEDRLNDLYDRNDQQQDSGSPDSMPRESLQTTSLNPPDLYKPRKRRGWSGAGGSMAGKSDSHPPPEGEGPKQRRQLTLPVGGREPDSPDSTAYTPMPPGGDKLTVTVGQILAVHPPFAAILRDYLMIEPPERARARAVIDAAKLLAGQLGVSNWCWVQGCRAHGPAKAALAAVVAAAKPAHEIRKSRGAFLAGLLLRPPGDLHPLASFHALRKRR